MFHYVAPCKTGVSISQCVPLLACNQDSNSNGPTSGNAPKSSQWASQIHHISTRIGVCENSKDFQEGLWPLDCVMFGYVCATLLWNHVGNVDAFGCLLCDFGAWVGVAGSMSIGMFF